MSRPRGLLGDTWPVAIDLETTGLLPQAGAQIIGVGMSDGTSSYYVVWNDATESAFRQWWDKLKHHVYHNATFDLSFFKWYGFDFPEKVDDTMVGAVLDDDRRLSFVSKRGVSLDAVAEEYFGVGKGVAQDILADWCKENGPGLLGMDLLDNRKVSGWRRSKSKWKMALKFAPHHMVADYVDQDVRLPLALLKKLRPNAAYPREMSMIPLVVDMEAEPKWLDVAYMARLEASLEEQEIALTDGMDFNPFSSKQCAEKLYGELRLPILTKTKGGAPSTDKTTLTRLAPLSKIPEAILKVRKLRKYRSTYIKGFREKSHGGAVYPRFHSWSTQTGRFSSRGPNFQNVPRDPTIRNMIEAPEGEIMLLIDYAQIEPRLMAHFGRSPDLIAGYARGDDVYGIIAKKIFPRELTGVCPNDVKRLHKNLRQVAKVALLAVCYGAQAKKMRFILLTQADMQYSESQCKRLVFQIRKAFPQVFSFIKRHNQFVKEAGIITNAYGRTRQLGRKQGGAGIKDSFNSLVQGTAADVLKIAMLACREYIEDNNLSTRMIMTVHDEIGFYMPLAEVAHIGPISDLMSDRTTFRVGMLAEPSVAVRWGDKVELSKDRAAWGGEIAAVIAAA